MLRYSNERAPHFLACGCCTAGCICRTHGPGGVAAVCSYHIEANSDTRTQYAADLFMFVREIRRNVLVYRTRAGNCHEANAYLLIGMGYMEQRMGLSAEPLQLEDLRHRRLGEHVMTKEQYEAVIRLYHQWKAGSGRTLEDFLKLFSWEPYTSRGQKPTLMINLWGMWIGIEPDGYTHS